MIKNISKDITPSMLREELDIHYRNKFDFIYMPYDQQVASIFYHRPTKIKDMHLSILLTLWLYSTFIVNTMDRAFVKMIIE